LNKKRILILFLTLTVAILAAGAVSAEDNVTGNSTTDIVTTTYNSSSSPPPDSAADPNISGTVIDENGYDLRLIDDEKAQALKNTKFLSRIHFAWDQMKDTDKILSGLEILKKNKAVKSKDIVYLLIGYDTTEEEHI